MVKSKSKKKKKKGKQKPEEPALSRKEQAILKRKRKAAIQKFTKTIGICVLCAVALGVPLYFTAEPKIAIAVGGGLPVFYLCYQYPRPALWFFLIYMPFSGTVVYWIAGGNALFQLAKDAFYIPAVLALALRCKKQHKPILIPKEAVPTFSLLLISALMTLFVVNGLMQVSPDKDGIPFAQGILGLKVLVGYVPLIFCAYYLIETKRELLWVTRLHTVLAIICCVLCLMQYQMLKSGTCTGTEGLGVEGDELFKASLDAKCLVGGALTYTPSQNQIRLPGTFVSPWHWGWFLIANSALTFASAFCDPSLLWRFVGMGGMGLVFICSVISGQRIATLLVPVIILILLVLTGQVANLKRFLPIGVGLGLALTIAAASNPQVIQERIESTQSRLRASPPQAFIEEQFHWSIAQQKGIFGRGLGKATNSTRIFGKAVLVETYHPKLLYEMGWPGLFAFLIFTTHLTRITFVNYRRAKDKSLRSFGSSFWVFILIISFFPYWYPLDTDPVCVYYWFLIGILMKLPEIDKEEQKKLKEAGEIEAEAIEAVEARSRDRLPVA
ncbi:MAG: hormogonium polysaccharide biosynthesis protein HpsL [Cyanobacteriota bacterium]|nr:hormogonium polysaccharide biosynthesis protein HpsL [Cyanobacteriota bacterium]